MHLLFIFDNFELSWKLYKMHIIASKISLEPNDQHKLKCNISKIINDLDG